MPDRDPERRLTRNCTNTTLRQGLMRRLRDAQHEKWTRTASAFRGTQDSIDRLRQEWSRLLNNPDPQFDRLRWIEATRRGASNK